MCDRRNHMTYIDFLSVVHKSTRRDYLARVNDPDYPKAKAAELARKWGYDSRSGSGAAGDPDTSRSELPDIQRRYRLFRDQMHATRATLDGLAGTTIYGYGAAQMLPVLGYHLGTDFGQLAAVLDDDTEKDGIGYWNLPVKIMSSGRVQDIAGSSVLITAIDNVQPIMTRLLAKRPRRILYPFHLI